MRTRLTAGEKPNRKRMAALVTVYDAGPAKRRPHDVIAPPGGRHGDRRLRPGPEALAKWLAGSVRKDPAEVIAAAFDEAGARDPWTRQSRARSPPGTCDHRERKRTGAVPVRPHAPIRAGRGRLASRHRPARLRQRGQQSTSSGSWLSSWRGRR